MIDAIDKIRSYIQDLDYAGFSADGKTIDAVVRNLEIIGEAAKHISASLVPTYDPQDWVRIGSMRNKLIHDYADTNVSLVWETVTGRLDDLEQALREADRVLGENDEAET
jgi:uncharacterized protein with HEPN domain